MTICLLSAPSGAGKTTFCAALAEQARAAGWDVAGILSPPVFENGEKVGIRAQNLRTGETRLLAVASHLPLSTFHLPLGNWLFDPSIIAWGNEILVAALPCDLFIVDELGPLELMRGEGWTNALQALRQLEYKIGVAVIRPSLVETACQVLPVKKSINLPLDINQAMSAIAG